MKPILRWNPVLKCWYFPHIGNTAIDRFAHAQAYKLSQLNGCLNLYGYVN